MNVHEFCKLSYLHSFIRIWEVMYCNAGFHKCYMEFVHVCIVHYIHVLNEKRSFSPFLLSLLSLLSYTFAFILCSSTITLLSSTLDALLNILHCFHAAQSVTIHFSWLSFSAVYQSKACENGLYSITVRVNKYLIEFHFVFFLFRPITLMELEELNKFS